MPLLVSQLPGYLFYTCSEKHVMATALTSEQLLSLIDLTKEISRLGMNLTAVMNLVVERLPGLMAADGAVIELKEQDSMVYRAASGLAASYIGLKLAIGQSLSGACITERKLQICPDVKLDPRANLVACQRLGIQAMLLVPLMHFDQVVGVLKIVKSEPCHFSAQQIEFLELVSEQIGTAMYFCTRYGEDTLFYLATHDAMTRLANRSLFMETLHQAVQQAHRCVLVLMLDMNELKPINDTYGHKAGDACLIELAKRITEGCRSADLVARMGGDEFAVLMVLEKLPDIQSLTKRLLDEIQKPFLFESISLKLSCGIGAASSPDEVSDALILLDLADQRMYQHKKQMKAKV